MKKKIALLLVLVLAFSMVLVSCSSDDSEASAKYLGFKGYYNTDFEEEKLLTSATKISELDNLQYNSSAGDVLEFENTSAAAGSTKLAYYNVKTGKVVKSYIMENYYDGYVIDATLFGIADDSLILERKYSSPTIGESSYTYTVYTSNGSKVASKTTKDSSSDFEILDSGCGVFLFDGKVYWLDEGSAEYRCDKGFISVPSCDLVTEKYAYEIDQEDGTAFIYNKSYGLHAAYVAPVDAEVSYIGILADGNLIIQYIIPLASDAESYDVIEVEEDGSAQKLDLTTVIYNVAKKSQTEIDFNYVIGMAINTLVMDEFRDLFTKKVTNAVAAYEIVDQRLDNRSQVCLSINNSGSILGLLAKEVPVQRGTATLFADNRFVVRDMSGKRYVINEKAKIIGEITDADEVEDGYVIAEDGKVYDADLKLVYDPENDVYEYGYNGLYTKSTDYVNEYYIRYNYQYIKLNNVTYANYSTFTGEYGYYTYVDYSSGTDYKVYINEKGEQIFKFQMNSVDARYSASVAYASDDVIILALRETTGSGWSATTETEYYVIK